MREATHTTTVHAAADVLWDYLADYANILKLASSEATGELIDGEAAMPGARYTGMIPWHGLKSHFEVTLTEADWPDALTWTSDSPSAVCSVRLLIRPISRSESEVTATVQYDSTPAAVPLEPFAWGLLDRFYQNAMARLHVLELPGPVH